MKLLLLIGYTILVSVVAIVAVSQGYSRGSILFTLFLAPILVGVFIFCIYALPRRAKEGALHSIATGNTSLSTVRKMNLIGFFFATLLFCYVATQLFHHADLSWLAWISGLLGFGAGISIAHEYLYSQKSE